MKKLLLVLLLSMFPLFASEYFLNWGAKAGNYRETLLLSSSLDAGIVTSKGVFGFGKDLSAKNWNSDATAFLANDYFVSFEYLHYGYIFNFGRVKLDLGYDIGGGAVTTQTEVLGPYLQMEFSADVHLAVGEQWALFVGYAQPVVFSETYSDTNYGKVALGFRLISK